MEVIYLPEALADLEFRKLSGNRNVMDKISALIHEIQITRFTGTGKPEALKYGLAGKWSRCITKEDQVVYRLSDTQSLVYSPKGHY